MQGIYKITNIVNGKFYIGSSCDIERRWSEHRTRNNGGQCNNKLIQRAWIKYGEENFKFEILEVVENSKQLLTREQYWITQTKCWHRNIGYNIMLDPRGGSKGRIVSEETRSKMRERNRGEKHNLAKLTENDVIKIKIYLKERTYPHRVLAEMFNVSKSLITKINTGKHWSHITV